MNREHLIKKALFKLTSDKFENLRKEFLEYLKENSKDVFEWRDVKVSARIEYVMDGKDVEDIKVDDVEFEKAKVHGFSDILHDLYMDANKNEKPKDEMCREYGTMLHKDLVGKKFPFKSKVDDSDVSGTILVKKTKYDALKDEVTIEEAEIDDFEVD